MKNGELFNLILLELEQNPQLLANALDNWATGGVTRHIRGAF